MLILKVKKYKNVYQTLEKFNKMLNYKYEIKAIKAKETDKAVTTIGITMDVVTYIDLLEQIPQFENSIIRFIEER